eukprot:CAMPEP_0171297492 /NCGR_PEP_ID=MMETSP0816-20121228/6228_1 /TAXON_ID=420281 /ORGANISM="Proboscia inermis, Strain CCAP1064/1" /LENGTH=107 /DNA_ID=CAMNT_0011771791 /DNA_START=116 /DNA_END=439 /DNA_ORIENTATION=-
MNAMLNKEDDILASSTRILGSSFVTERQFSNRTLTALTPALRKYGILIIVIVSFVGLYLLYLAFMRWRRVREFQVMEQTNRHADDVLGDISLGVGGGASLDEEDEII